jgi:hypothetical protein
MNQDLQCHLDYAKHLLHHKWEVAKAGRHLGVSWWRCIFHDWTKLFWDEWNPYVAYFYGIKYHPDSKVMQNRQYAFDTAWNKHQKRNKHHWQYWLLTEDSGRVIPLEMPWEDVKEMVADWIGASKASGDSHIFSWYHKNQSKMLIHINTQHTVELILFRLREEGYI